MYCVIASEERARQSRTDCFGLRPRNDVGYGGPALGIGATSFFRTLRYSKGVGKRYSGKPDPQGKRKKKKKVMRFEY